MKEQAKGTCPRQRGERARRAIVVLGTVAMVAGCTRPRENVEQRADAASGLALAGPASSPTAAKEAPRQPPPEPPPPLAGQETQSYAVAVGADKTYLAIWDEKNRADRDLFLTALSDVVLSADRAGKGVRITVPVVAALKKKGLFDSVMKFTYTLPRLGTFQPELVDLIKRHLAATRGEEHLGVWRPRKATDPPVDYSALAFWLNRGSPEYAREFLAAKSTGPIRWVQIREPLRPELAKEIDALEWLAALAPLTTSERSRLDDLRSSPLKDDPGEDVSVTKLLAEYRDNEVRADDAFKGHVVRVTGTVGEVKKDALGTIYVILSTPDAQVSRLQCFFDDRFAKKAAALSRGDRLTVRGRVSGLVLMNVLLSNAEDLAQRARSKAATSRDPDGAGRKTGQMQRVEHWPLGGAASNDNDDDGTAAALLAKVEHLATRAAALGFTGDKESTRQTLRALVPLCLKLGEVRIPHLYQSGTEYAASIERVLAREHVQTTVKRRRRH